MQTPAIHDPYAGATPSQMSAIKAHNSRAAGIARRARNVTPKQVISFSIPNTPFGVPKIPPPIIVKTVRQMTARPNYSGMWFYGLVSETEGRDPAVPLSKRKPRINEIQAACSKFYRVKVSDIVGERRTSQMVRPRQVGMFLASRIIDKSLPEIGRRFGNRDHTTALHAIRRIEQLMASGTSSVSEEVKAVKALLAEQFDIES